MVSDEIGAQLHDRATRGLPLSTEEQALLSAWYARQDEEEHAQFAAAGPPQLATLRKQVNATLTQIIAVSQRIQTVSQENESLRKEIAALEQSLAQQTSGRS
jgi:hypothetical protein